VLCAEYLCGYLTDGGEDGVLVRRVSRLAARYTARVAETATEWAVNMRWLRVAQEAAAPPSKRSPASSRARESPGCVVIKFNAAV
jgi:hypothetical protein